MEAYGLFGYGVFVTRASVQLETYTYARCTMAMSRSQQGTVSAVGHW